MPKDFDPLILRQLEFPVSKFLSFLKTNQFFIKEGCKIAPKFKKVAWCFMLLCTYLRA